MKRVLRVLIFCLMAAIAVAQTQAQTTPTKHHKKSAGSTNSAGEPGEAAPDPAADQAKMVDAYKQTFVPSDPWRVMNEKTNFAKGSEWVQFEGRVTAMNGTGLVLQGWFGEPLCYMLPNNGGATTTTFLLSNYPRHVAVG